MEPAPVTGSRTGRNEQVSHADQGGSDGTWSRAVFEAAALGQTGRAYRGRFWRSGAGQVRASDGSGQAGGTEVEASTHSNTRS